MSLKGYEGKEVQITDVDGMTITGIVSDYVWPDDNENGKESIIVNPTRNRAPYEFYEDDIKEIEILQG